MLLFKLFSNFLFKLLLLDLELTLLMFILLIAEIADPGLLFT